MAGLGAIPKPSPSNLSLQQQRWNAATVRVEKQSETRWIARKIERNQARYETISKSANVPWQIVASIHSMECGLNFGQHLHNGDPLTARTRQVPAGRPKTGRPPFSFEESAKDALEYDGLNQSALEGLESSLGRAGGLQWHRLPKTGNPDAIPLGGNEFGTARQIRV